MERIFGGHHDYHIISPSKSRQIYHLAHTPPEYWTPEQRMQAGKWRTQWLREEQKRAARGGSPQVLDRIWPVGPYWPNGDVLVGGEKARREFRNHVGRARFLDQARVKAQAQHYHVHPSHLPTTSSSRRNRHILLDNLKSQGDWTRYEPNQILNDLCDARLDHDRNNASWRKVGQPIFGYWSDDDEDEEDDEDDYYYYYDGGGWRRRRRRPGIGGGDGTGRRGRRRRRVWRDGFSWEELLRNGRFGEGVGLEEGWAPLPPRDDYFNYFCY